MNFGILVLLLALILFGVLAFKQMSALILAPVVTIFVLVCFRMPILDALKNAFMPTAASYFTKYFLVFFVGALFGAVYQYTGAAKSIAKFLVGKCNGKFVAPIIMTITGVLTYGGVSGFVVFFVVYPIAVQVFRSANVTRRLIPAAISAGCWTWSMYGPGSPSIQNVIPITDLGTTPTAAFIPSLIVTVLSYVLIFIWLEYRTRVFTSKGIVFDDPTIRTQLTEDELRSDEEQALPNILISFIPIFLILFFFNAPLFLNAQGVRTGLPVETAVIIGVFSAFILMYKHVIGGIWAWIQVFNKGAADSGVAILNTCIVVGFGGIVQKTSGFSDLVEALKGWNMHPLLFVMLTVAICAGACGSASGGMGVAFDALKDTYISIGAKMPYVHRISAIAAGTLDTLPHQGAQITLLSICKLTHKEAYFDIAITQIAIPFICCFAFIGLAVLGL